MTHRLEIDSPPQKWTYCTNGGIRGGSFNVPGKFDFGPMRCYKRKDCNLHQALTSYFARLLQGLQESDTEDLAKRALQLLKQGNYLQLNLEEDSSKEPGMLRALRNLVSRLRAPAKDSLATPEWESLAALETSPRNVDTLLLITKSASAVDPVHTGLSACIYSGFILGI